MTTAKSMNGLERLPATEPTTQETGWPIEPALAFLDK